jgi:hypothetical protein
MLYKNCIFTWHQSLFLIARCSRKIIIFSLFKRKIITMFPNHSHSTHHGFIFSPRGKAANHFSNKFISEKENVFHQTTLESNLFPALSKSKSEASLNVQIPLVEKSQQSFFHTHFLETQKITWEEEEDEEDFEVPFDRMRNQESAALKKYKTNLEALHIDALSLPSFTRLLLETNKAQRLIDDRIFSFQAFIKMSFEMFGNFMSPLVERNFALFVSHNINPFKFSCAFRICLVELAAHLRRKDQIFCDEDIPFIASKLTHPCFYIASDKKIYFERMIPYFQFPEC